MSKPRKAHILAWWTKHETLCNRDPELVAISTDAKRATCALCLRRNATLERAAKVAARRARAMKP